MDNSLIIPEIDFDVDPAPILIDEQEIDEIFIREAIRKDKGKARKRRRTERPPEEGARGGRAPLGRQRRRTEQGPIIPYFPPSVEDFQPVLINEEEITEIFLQTSSSQQASSSSSSSSRMTGKFKDIDVFKCKFCNKEFSITTSLKKHFQKAHEIHPDFIGGKETPFINKDSEQCYHCNKFVANEFMEYHIELFHERLKCTICKVNVRRKIQIPEHNLMKCKFDPKSNRNYYKCLVCNIEKPTRYLILLHYILNHLQYEILIISKKDKNKCLLCNKIYSKSERIDLSKTVKHYKNEHLEIHEEMLGNILFVNSYEHSFLTEEKESSKDSRYSKCVFCDFIPLHTEQYLKHLSNRHKGIGKVAGYRDNEKNSLSEYVLCPKCNRKVSEKLYPMHLDLIHERFKCFNCFTSFESRNVYENHILMSCRYDPLSEKKYYQCKICGHISSEKQMDKSSVMFFHVFKEHIANSNLKCPSCEFRIERRRGRQVRIFLRKLLKHVKQNHPEILEGIQSNFLYVNNKKEFEE